jgi:nitroreductase
METTTCVQERRTIRKFLPDPVPKDVIEEIISKALWAPSWGNTQPWEFMVVSGALMDRFKAENRNALMSGAHSKPDIRMPEEWPESLKARYKDVGRTLFDSLSIAREDVEARTNYYGDMFNIFDAPAMLLVLLDKHLLLEYAMLDVGLFLQTFMLLACDRGLGTAALAASVHFPQVARKLLPIPEDKHLAIGAAIGWPDKRAAVNTFQRKRASMQELVTWVA